MFIVIFYALCCAVGFFYGITAIRNIIKRKRLLETRALTRAFIMSIKEEFVTELNGNGAGRFFLMLDYNIDGEPHCVPYGPLISVPSTFQLGSAVDITYAPDNHESVELAGDLFKHTNKSDAISMIPCFLLGLLFLLLAIYSL